MGQVESTNKNTSKAGGVISGGSGSGGSQNYSQSNQNVSYTNFNTDNNDKSGSGSISKSTSTNEIITINQLERKEEFEPELNILYNTPIFYPLLSIDDDEDEDNNQLNDEERFIQFLKKKHQMTIPEMDQRGYLNLCIDIQNYLKNSTGYIHEKQNEILQKIRDVEIKQAKKITNIMQLKTSDATHAQFGVKEVLDKVKGNLDKSKEIIFKITDLIDRIEQCLPENELIELKEEMNATYGPLTNL